MKSSGAGRTLRSLGISLLVHAGIGIVAGSIVVYSYVKPPDMMFQAAAAKPRLAARTLEHSIRVQRSERQARRPRVMNKLVAETSRPAALPALPPVPPVASDARTAPTPASLAGAQLGAPGPGTYGIAALQEGLAGCSEAAFFGHTIQTRSIIILVDSSASIVKKGVFEDVRDEAIRMVDRFHPDTGFNVILFTDGSYAFNSEIVYATRAVKTEVRSWMKTEMKINRGNNSETSGSTPIVALRQALELEPDTIILITDDPPYIKGVDEEAHQADILDLVQRHRNRATTKVIINTVAYKPYRTGSTYVKEKGERARKFLKKLARTSGGSYREIQE